MAATLSQLVEAAQRYVGKTDARSIAALNRNLSLLRNRVTPVEKAVSILTTAEPLSEKPGIAIHQILAAIGATGVANNAAHPEVLTYNAEEVIALASPQQQRELALLGFFSDPGTHANVDYSLVEKFKEKTPAGGLDEGGQPIGGNWVVKEPYANIGAWAAYQAGE